MKENHVIPCISTSITLDNTLILYFQRIEFEVSLRLTFYSNYLFDSLMATELVPNTGSVRHKSPYICLFMIVFQFTGACYKAILFGRPLHLSVMTWNVAVVRRWVELASMEEIAEAIDIQSPVGTALCMAAASKKDHESGISWGVLLGLFNYGSNRFPNNACCFICKVLFLPFYLFNLYNRG